MPNPEILQKLKVIQGDITQEAVDAIVNAANNALLGGGGVDGAIHAAAGPELLVECKGLGGCPTGQAKLTSGYKLPAKFIIHTVGPIYGKENGYEDELLATTYNNCLLLALEKGFKTIAFPAISTGFYRFPKDKAAQIALDTVLKFLEIHNQFAEIRFVLHSQENFKIYSEILTKLKN